MPPITGDFLDAAGRGEFLQRIEIYQRADAQAVIVELIPDIGFIESAIVVIRKPFIHGIAAGLLDVVVDDAALDAIDEEVNIAPVIIWQAELFEEREHK